MPEKIFGNGNDGEDEGSRFSSETKVSDTFEADLGSLKKKATGNSKYMYGKCKGNNATDTDITRKEGPTDEFKINGNKNNNDKDLCGEMEDIRSDPSGIKSTKSNRGNNIEKRFKDNKMTKDQNLEGSTQRKDKREVSPSSSVRSGGDRLKKEES
ncbi:hypothetical protein Tco_0225272 [Tanacetum coccineum]